MIHPNQIRTAKEVIDGFENKSIILQMVLGNVKVGKLELCWLLLKNSWNEIL